MPHLHRKPRTCEVCLAAYQPSYYEQRTCGRACGVVLSRGRFPQSVVDWRHCEPCDAWHTRQSKTHRHKAPAKDTSWMTKVLECPMCGEGFTNPYTTIAVHCSPRCSKKAGKLRRRVREAGTYGEWRWSDFMRVARLFDYCCAYCGDKPERLDPDHVLPLSRGGPNIIGNLLPTCAPCNSDKNASSPAEWAERRTLQGKPPRRTAWAPDDPRYWHLTVTAVYAAA